MDHYLTIFRETFYGYSRYLWDTVLTPHWGNYFYWLLAISAIVYVWELLFPWRRQQNAIREDFWLDLFYMFFNFFLFGLVGYAAVSMVVVTAFNDLLWIAFGVKNLVAIEIGHWSYWAQLLILFFVRDFIQWNVHRLLHWSPWLWQFHQVHHSVREMGFAAHMRYHFMETLVYRSIEYLPLAMIGFGIQDFILVHLFTIVVGHLNHANIFLPLGPLKYALNSPQMHIWHHAKDIPAERNGVNFGITLSLWDYLFGSAWVPGDGRDIKLGFPEVDTYPHGFFSQMVRPFKKWGSLVRK
jgi:sterol desaturase/sphingolipid hydroxylase (fatty acid hydroxylase superfamily)